MTITKQQVDSWDAEVKDAYQRGYEAGAKSTAVDSQDLTIAYMAGRHDAQKSAASEPVAWMSKTGHGTYFRESITPELAALEHGGNKMWTPLYATPPAEAKREPIAYFDFQEHGFYWAKNVVHGPVPVSIKVEPMPLYATPPAEAKREPLSESEILDWWSSENGLEDCRMCVSTDFIQMVRAVEKRQNIGAKEQ